MLITIILYSFATRDSASHSFFGGGSFSSSRCESSAVGLSGVVDNRSFSKEILFK
jgi:hypothetical protein